MFEDVVFVDTILIPTLPFASKTKSSAKEDIVLAPLLPFDICSFVFASITDVEPIKTRPLESMRKRSEKLVIKTKSLLVDGPNFISVPSTSIKQLASTLSDTSNLIPSPELLILKGYDGLEVPKPMKPVSLSIAIKSLLLSSVNFKILPEISCVK